MLASTATGLAERQFDFPGEAQRSAQNPHQEETEEDFGSGMGRSSRTTLDLQSLEELSF